MRVLKLKLSPGKHKIIKMKDQQENIISDNRDIVAHIEEFYTRFYISTVPDSIFNNFICNVGSEDIPTKQNSDSALSNEAYEKSLVKC